MFLNKISIKIGFAIILSGACHVVFGQEISQSDSQVAISSPYYSILINKHNGKIDFEFRDGVRLINTISLLKVGSKLIKTSDLATHEIEVTEVRDKIGTGKLVRIWHQSDTFKLIQYITLYKDEPFILISASAEKNEELFESNYFSPLAVTIQDSGSGFIPGSEPRLMDIPFDNDNWTKLLTVKWTDNIRSGVGYEFTSLYDYETLRGLVIGNLSHDFWKTGIQYALSDQKGKIDSLIIYGGAATADNKGLPNEYGGYDGTHDVVPHGNMEGRTIFAPLIFLSGDSSITSAFRRYGEMNAAISGSLKWAKDAPFYWNSFGVENVLGHQKVMMPSGVSRISDFLSSLKNFNSHRPFLSIDSYDQEIYTTNVLNSIGTYAKKRNQQMGFYFIPFAIWTWKSGIDNSKLQYTDYYIRDVSLKDNHKKTIVYKDGEFGAFALDPTHPGTRQRIIAELQKAKAIDANFLKIDFLSAGAMETPRHYNPEIRSGMQAYNFGMKMLNHLIDSILGPDVFITQAISPIFPSQYAHARFLSTDIYSHFRDDSPDFPHYGSTASSMITNSQLGWMQGTIIPFTNLDVLIMKKFQKNMDLSEGDIKARLFSLITLGSILGDGSDYRNNLAAERATKYLDNKNVTNYFAKPRAFIPIKFSDGLTPDQQLCFYLPGDTVLLSSFNFDLKNTYSQKINKKSIGLKEGINYMIKDFLTNDLIKKLEKNEDSFTWITGEGDSRLVRFIPETDK